MLTVLAEDGNLPRGEYEHASKTLLNILFAGIRQRGHQLSSTMFLPV